MTLPTRRPHKTPLIGPPRPGRHSATAAKEPEHGISIVSTLHINTTHDFTDPPTRTGDCRVRRTDVVLRTPETSDVKFIARELDKFAYTENTKGETEPKDAIPEHEVGR